MKNERCERCIKYFYFTDLYKGLCSECHKVVYDREFKRKESFLPQNLIEESKNES